MILSFFIMQLFLPTASASESVPAFQPYYDMIHESDEMLDRRDVVDLYLTALKASDSVSLLDFLQSGKGEGDVPQAARFALSQLLPKNYWGGLSLSEVNVRLLDWEEEFAQMTDSELLRSARNWLKPIYKKHALDRYRGAFYIHAVYDPDFTIEDMKNELLSASYRINSGEQIITKAQFNRIIDMREKVSLSGGSDTSLWMVQQ